jgi:hypothetical protein
MSALSEPIVIIGNNSRNNSETGLIILCRSLS